MFINQAGIIVSSISVRVEQLEPCLLCVGPNLPGLVTLVSVAQELF